MIFYDKPLIKFERLLETYLAYAPRGLKSFLIAMPIWLKEKLYLKSTLKQELAKLGDCDKEDLPRLLFTEHHQSHAASAFYPSPFESAAVLCLDGVGEWATGSTWLGQGADLKPLWEIDFPHSLGLLYSAFTYYTGFKVNSGEYKLMGLAPYGEPRFRDRILDQLIDVKPDGTFRLDMSYFNYCTGLTMTNARFDALVRGAAASAGIGHHPARDGPGRIGAGGHRGGRAASGQDAAGRDRRKEPVSCRWRGAQLRGQRQAAARGSVRADLGAAGGRRRRRRARSGAAGLARIRAEAAHPGRAGRDVRLLSRAGL